MVGCGGFAEDCVLAGALESIDVFVVAAGVTGLAIAGELTASGVMVTIAERLRGPTWAPARTIRRDHRLSAARQVGSAHRRPRDL
jgi:choline dehydrogenase-like flavoprotein